MDLVDTERYPIDRPASDAAQELVRHSKQRFVENGVVTLPGFLREDAIAAITRELEPHAAEAFYCRSTHNVLLDDGDPSLHADHPRNRRLQTNVGSIANDLLPPASALQRLYDWPHLTTFIGHVLGHNDFYCGADPLGALSANVYGEGDGHGWHFDESHFSVTLSIQQPTTGGHFEYVTNARTATGIDVDRVQALLDGDERDVQRLAFKPGTLSIFGGRDTLHRVTPIAGDQPRLVPVLTYDVVPGSVNSDAVRQLFWGRTS